MSGNLILENQIDSNFS